MIAAGTYVTKLLVSVAFIATEGGGDPAVQAPHADTEAAIVRVGVSPERTLNLMEVEMPNGEFYALAGVGTQEAAPAAGSTGSARRIGGRMTGRSAYTARPSTTLAMLESETGRSMECHVEVPPEDGSGSATCTSDKGEKLEFAFQVQL
jgi:hypothetical protein